MATIKSIEEKAKRYDKAIEQLRAMMPNWENLSYNGKTFLQDLVHIIPELKESEGEKIRNFLIKQANSVLDSITDDDEEVPAWKSALAWLEKQGEQKPTIEMITPEESLGVDSDTYNKIVDECIYGEQKLTDKVNSNLLTVERANEISPFMKTVFENEPTDKVAPRQYELTEFEKAVKQVMEEAIECGDTHNLKADAEMLLRLVQKPWSEEDKYNHNIILYLLNNECVGNADRRIAIEWFKSLKDRYTWKPSDKQMEALDDVIDEYDGYPEFDSLVSLKNDLKKLREK